MNAWILVIMMYTSDTSTMYTVSSYASQKRCEEVAEIFLESRRNNKVWREAFCFPKR